MFTKIKITSNCYDFAGAWKKEDIESEMKDFGIEINYPYEWIEYLFDHVFSDIDDDGINSVLIEFAKFDALEEIKIRIDGYWARITKEK